MHRLVLNESNRGSVMTRRPARRALTNSTDSPPPNPPIPTYLLPYSLCPTHISSPLPHQLPTTCSDLYLLQESVDKRRTSVEASGFSIVKSSTTIFTKKKLGSTIAVKKIINVPVYFLLLMLLLLSLVPTSIMGTSLFPRSKPMSKIFKSKFCQPVSREELRRRLGAAIDESRTAEEMGSDGYQSDGTGAFDLSDTDLVAEERDGSSEDMVVREEEMVYNKYSYGSIRERARFEFDFKNGKVEKRGDIEEDFFDNAEDESGRKTGEWETFKNKPTTNERSWMPRRRIISPHHWNNKGVYSVNTKDTKNGNSQTGSDFFSDSKTYMRRRRAALPVDGKDEKRFGGDFKTRRTRKHRSRKFSRKKSNTKDRKSSGKVKVLLPLRITLSGNARNTKQLRRQLKKEYREKNKLRDKSPPWECKMEKKTLIMRKNVFPEVISNGKCLTSKCFYRLYNCEPVKYALKILYRDEDHCNPLPLIGNATVFEEHWKVTTKHITVGCNCASIAGKGKNKHRRKN